jgi:hypothetical protein
MFLEQEFIHRVGRNKFRVCFLQRTEICVLDIKHKQM